MRKRKDIRKWFSLQNIGAKASFHKSGNCGIGWSTVIIPKQKWVKRGHKLI